MENFMKNNKLIFSILFVCLIIIFSSTAMAVQSRAERKYFLSEESYEYENFIKNEPIFLKQVNFIKKIMIK